MAKYTNNDDLTEYFRIYFKEYTSRFFLSIFMIIRINRSYPKIGNQIANPYFHIYLFIINPYFIIWNHIAQ